MIKSGIYEIQNLTNGKVYVGSSQNLQKRKCGHFCNLRKGTSGHPYLQNAWNRYGEKNFKFSVLIYCSIDDLLLYEQRFLDIVQSKYNSSPTAGNNRGHKHSDEAKKNMSKARLGIEFSKEHRRNISKALSNTKRSSLSKERKHKISEALLGRKLSKERKHKISEALLGRKLSKEHRRNISKTLLGNTRGKGGKGKDLTEEHKRSISKGLKEYYQRRRLNATKN